MTSLPTAPRRLGILLALLVAIVVACGGEQSADSSSPLADRVVVIGDSISEQSADAITEALADTSDVVVLARIGRTFETSQFSIDVASAENPSVVVVELGTNDVWTETPLPDVVEDLDQLVTKFPNACLVMVTVNEQTKNARSLDGTIYDNERAQELNDVLVARADQVVDWNAEANTDPGRYLDSGTIHPTEEGRRLLASLMARASSACAT